MKTEKVTCDGCGADLTRRTNSVDYRLVLASESKPGHGSGFYTDMMIYPAIQRAHHFCDLACLDHWRGRERKYNALWREDRDSRATKVGDRVYSYTELSEEDRAVKDAEFLSTALAAFPMERPPHN